MKLLFFSPQPRSRPFHPGRCVPPGEVAKSLPPLFAVFRNERSHCRFPLPSFAHAGATRNSEIITGAYVISVMQSQSLESFAVCRSPRSLLQSGRCSMRGDHCILDSTRGMRYGTGTGNHCHFPSSGCNPRVNILLFTSLFFEPFSDLTCNVSPLFHLTRPRSCRRRIRPSAGTSIHGSKGNLKCATLQRSSSPGHSLHIRPSGFLST